MKNVVITGSTRGIGFCMAKEFLKAGCNVTISSRSEKSLELPHINCSIIELLMKKMRLVPRN